MPTGFSLGVQNADVVYDGIADGDAKLVGAAVVAAAFDDVLVTTAILTTTDIALGIAHGLSATPNFVLMTLTPGNNSEGTGWSANATTLTLTKVDTQAIQTASVFAAVLS